MKLLRNSFWFWLFLSLFIGHQVLEKGMDIRITFLDNYLDDLLCMPLLLSGWLAERYDLFNKKSIDPLEIVFLWLLMSVLFEVLLPQMFPQYTADIWDVVCYGIGGFLYYLLINPKEVI